MAKARSLGLKIQSRADSFLGDAMSLREEVREWLVDKRVGLIDSEELQRRADRKIAGLDAPPDYLIVISLGESLAHIERLDLVREPLTREDLGKLAVRLLAGLKTGCLDLETVAVAATHITFPRHDKMIDAWVEFAWIIDEWQYIEDGMKGPEGYEDGVFAALERVARHAPAHSEIENNER